MNFQKNILNSANISIEELGLALKYFTGVTMWISLLWDGDLFLQR